MKLKSLLIILVVAILLTACSTDGEIEKFSIDTDSGIDEASLQIINEYDYMGKDIVETKEMGNPTLYKFKETVSFEEAYPDAEIIDLSNVELPHSDASVSGVDENGIVYYSVQYAGPTSQFYEYCAIYSYNPWSKEWKTLVETDETRSCSFVAANEKYLLWHEDKNSNWQKLSLNLLDLETMENRKIYTFAINPETGLMYSRRFSEPAICGDYVYFDDTVGIDKDGIYKIKTFSYSISKNKLTEMDEDAKWTMEYKGDVAWLKMTKDKKNSMFYSLKDKKALLKTEARLGTTFASGGNLIAAHDSLPQGVFDNLQNPAVDVFENEGNNPRSYGEGIKLIADNKVEPIVMVGLGSISTPITNGDIIGWNGQGIGSPLFYSYSKDKLIEFSNITSQKQINYGYKMSDNFAILMASSYDGNSYRYMWRTN